MQQGVGPYNTGGLVGHALAIVDTSTVCMCADCGISPLEAYLSAGFSHCDLSWLRSVQSSQLPLCHMTRLRRVPYALAVNAEVYILA